MKFTDETELEWSAEQQTEWEGRLKVGQALLRYLAPAAERQWNAKLDNIQQSKSPFGRMSADALVEVETYLDEVRDEKIRAQFFADAVFERTFPSLLFSLIDGLIETDEAIRTVVNIGAYFAYIDHKLALKHPDIQFHAVDLVPGMTEYNAPRAAPNLTLTSGYALDLIAEDKLPGDLFGFCATAAEIKNNELRAYFCALHGRARYVVLSEPIYYIPGGGLVDPETVPLDRSVVAYIQPDFLPHRRGPIAYVHNLRAMLKEANYDVLHYNARKLEFSELRWVDIVAVPKGAPTA